MRSILIIEDDLEFKLMLEKYFKSKDFKVSSYASAKAALENFNPIEYDCIISDLIMDDMDGIEFIYQVRKFDRYLPIILITAYGSIKAAVSSIKMGAVDFIEKPFDLNSLYKIVMQHLSVSEIDNEKRLKHIQLKQNLSKLTLSEKKILKLVASGLSSKEIAEKVNLSARTVEAHRYKMMTKLGIKSSLHLALVISDLK